MKDFVANLPKVELHLHIEGTLEPQMMLDFAHKNNISLPYRNITEVQNAYSFNNLQSFLDLYYLGTSSLCSREDFYELTWTYMLRCHQENIVHTEIFFDPQAHTMRGVAIQEVILGITQALQKARQELGISSYLVACILRHLSLEEGLRTLEELLPFKNEVIGIGLDSSEIGNPPSKFKELFTRAQKEGFLLVAHAGEEGGADYVSEALDCGVGRIDHGVRCEEDDALVEFLIANQIPLTMCPLSNLKLKVFQTIKEHNLVRLLKRGACVTINSDDPAYFGGYMNANFEVIAEAFDLTCDDLKQLSINAINASFLPREQKEFLKHKVQAYKNL